MSSILVKTPYYSPWFLARILKFGLRPKRIPCERASQEEQNDANFSSIAPSTVELWVTVYLNRALPISDGLLKMLYVVLLHQPMKHPGAPRSTPHPLPPTPSQPSLQDADVSSVTLALQTLGTFNFGGEPHTITPSHYHTHPHTIRPSCQPSHPHTLTRTHTHTHTHTHTRTHTHTHTHTH